MAKKSVFRDFMTVLRKKWKTEAPIFQPISEARGHLPKASTFYVGKVKDSGMHVFLYFQHSCKSWEVGQFTINIVLDIDEQNPRMYPGKKSGSHFGEGWYRVGELTVSKDKWWHLKQQNDDDRTPNLAWHPSSYEDPAVVIAEAIEDVTRDIFFALKLMNVNLVAQNGVDKAISNDVVQDSSGLTLWHQCPCCDYITLDERGSYLICRICFWEDDGFDVDKLDVPSGANSGLTLRQARANFGNFGACEQRLINYVIPTAQRVEYDHKPRDLS